MALTILLVAAACGGEGEPEDPYGLSERPLETTCVVQSDDGAGGFVAPTMLSATECYADIAAKTVAEGLLPFDLTSALWSDGEVKRRWFWIPPDTSIGYTDAGALNLPVGTVAMKEFILLRDDADADDLQHLETRFIVRNEDAWRFYNYRWDADGSDATLVVDDVTDFFEVQRGGESVQFRHDTPSPLQCIRCHPSEPGTVRGLQGALLNRDIEYAEAVDNQLRTLEHIGMFSEALPAPVAELPRLPEPHDVAAGPLALRARSFLHSNCSHCHQPGGSAVTTRLDLRYQADLVEGGVCDLIVPGQSEVSTLWQRMELLDMPPIVTFIASPQVGLVSSWIDAMQTCP